VIVSSPKSRKIIYIDDVRLLAITSYNTPGFIKKSNIVIASKQETFTVANMFVRL